MFMNCIGLSNSYKCLYDGMTCDDPNVLEECSNYFFKSFGKFIEEVGGIEAEGNSYFHHFLQFF